MTHDELKSVLDYNPDTGIFTWLKSRKKSKVGKKAGSTTKKGYLQICIAGKSYLLHRLAVFYTDGVEPDGVVIHINCDLSDNKRSNLSSERVSKTELKDPWMYKGINYKPRYDEWMLSLNIDDCFSLIRGS